MSGFEPISPLPFLRFTELPIRLAHRCSCPIVRPSPPSASRRLRRQRGAAHGVQQPRRRVLARRVGGGPAARRNASPALQHNESRSGECKKQYPLAFNSETVLGNSDIYPNYRRRSPRDGGATAEHKGRLIDNQWVVPYSPYLLLKYKCHINVECCLSVRGVKYLYKYVHKGPDRAMVALHKSDARTTDGGVRMA